MRGVLNPITSMFSLSQSIEQGSSLGEVLKAFFLIQQCFFFKDHRITLVPFIFACVNVCKILRTSAKDTLKCQSVKNHQGSYENLDALLERSI